MQRIETLDEKSGLSIFNRIFPFGLIFNYDYDVLSFPYKMNHTFRFMIDEESDPVEHSNGQIESDSNVLMLPVAKEPKVVVIEAKFGESNPSIAKHKVLYATMVARKLFGEKAEILPAYLRVIDYKTVVKFNFCTINIRYKNDLPVLTSITPSKAFIIKIERHGTLFSKDGNTNTYSTPLIDEVKEEFI